MTPQLTIGRMHATYVSPRTRSSPDALRGRLDPVLHDRFGSACGGAIADLSAQADESVWVIRHLDVDLGLRLDGVHDDDIATRWANEVARQIARTLRRGPDGATVLRFSDRAAYLAYFVRRLIETGEWDDTLFPRFKGLKVLTRASAAITALTREPDLIERVLATLHGERLLDALLDTLRDDEVEVILDAMGDAAPSLDATLVEQLLPALIDVLLRASCDSLTARMTIEVLLAARAAGAQGPAQTLVATIRHCADLILGSLRRTGNTVDVAARDVASADALIARLPPATRAWLAQPGGQALIAQVASALRGKTVVATAGASHASRTMYAGAWLLLPALESSGVDAAVNILRLTGALRAALRCAVLARCLGNAAAAVDPLLFAACGGPEDQDPDAALDAALRRLRCGPGWLARMADAANEDDSASRMWRLHRVECAQFEVALAVDECDGQWRYAAPASRRQRHEKPVAVLAALARLVTRPDIVLVHDRIYPLAGTRSESYDSLPVRDARDERTIARDFAVLADDPRGSVHGEKNWAQAVVLAWLARRVLHGFQRRLPGFARSSVKHLRENFLAAEGAVTRTEDGFHIAIDPPPLGLVLRIAGWHDAMAAPAWLTGRNVRYSMGAA